MEHALLAIVAAALLLPALCTALMARRSGRMGGALLVAALFFAAALAVFGVATAAPHDDPDAIGQVILSLFVLAPAGLSALVGGAIGRLLAGRRR